jgi:hypothetical protein
MIGTTDLSLDQAPPISVPFRFFLTAPLFGVAAGVLLLALGPEALANRWAPPTLALTHLIALGFLASVMFGAAMQVLPVLAGVPVPGALPVAGVVHLALTLGSTALAVAFLLGAPRFFITAIGLLGGGFVLFLGAVGLALLRVQVGDPTVRGLGAAWIALLVTLLLGLYLAGAWSGLWVTALAALLTDLHLGWGLLGWVGLLLVAVAYRVVPLFQITPEYPAWLRRALVPALLLLLPVWSLAALADPRLFSPVLLPLVVGFVLFAVYTLRLQSQRRRRVPDLTLQFWRVAMWGLLATAVVWLAALLYPDWAGRGEYPLLLGVGMVGVVGLSVTNGMLYKIVPFLAWFHLQHRQMALMRFGLVEIPHMKALLPDRWARWQFRLHMAALALAVAAPFFPGLLARPLGLLLACSFGLLWINLVLAVRRYRQADRRLSEIAEAV